MAAIGYRCRHDRMAFSHLLGMVLLLRRVLGPLRQATHRTYRARFVRWACTNVQLALRVELCVDGKGAQAQTFEPRTVFSEVEH